jgi:hypothetical protein
VKPSAAEPAITPTQASTSSRIRRVTNQSSRLRSVLLVPVTVKVLAAARPVARSRVSVGALVALQTVGTDEIAGLALVSQAVGGGLGAVLSVRPTVEIFVDGERVDNAPALDARLYSITRGPWGPVETVMLPVLPALLGQIAGAAEAQVVLGNALHLALDRHQLAGFTELLREIPPDADFGLRRRSKALPKFITQ